MPPRTVAHNAVEDEVEQVGKESAAVTRGQNVVYQMPHDWSAAASVLGPAIDRVDQNLAELQLLVVTTDAEAAAGAAAAVVRLVGDRTVSVVAATSAKRAARLLRAGTTHVVTGTPSELLALLQGSSLKLATVRAVVLAWVDEVPTGESAALETVMAEVPKEAARYIAASEITPELETLIERYARRARRVAPATGTRAAPGLEYMSVSSASRLSALRRLLDHLDPARAAVYVRTDESERVTHELLRALGYGGQAPAVRVSRGAMDGDADLIVLYDLPASTEELGEVIGAEPRRVVALAQPRQLKSLRVLSGGAQPTPLTLPDAAGRARTREEQLRAELRATLETGGHARDVLALEPLLESYDGVEIAAAALRLLEQARAERDRSHARPAERGSAAAAPAMTRLFFNIGAMDNVRPGDLVGAITNEAGITSTQIGKIDIRDNHTIVEVASDANESVIAKLAGVVVRGRRLLVRADQERPGRPGAPGSRGRPGGPPRGDRSERGPRPERSPRRDERGRGDRNPNRSRGPGPRGPGSRATNGENSDRVARPPRRGDME